MKGNNENDKRTKNQNINGRSYIGGGRVDEDLYYYYAMETEFGYKIEKINGEIIEIFKDIRDKINYKRKSFDKNDKSEKSSQPRLCSFEWVGKIYKRDE